jgi:hypothetical protein
MDDTYPTRVFHKITAEAGYTLAELLLLSRSASTPQRAAAIHVLGEVLKRARIPAPQVGDPCDPVEAVAT